MTTPEAEVWMMHPTYEFYDVSTMGRVRSWRNARWGWRDEPRVLTLGLHTGGYLQVTLSHEGRAFPRYVHRLVLETFVGHCPDAMEACHNNGVRTDNRLENLRWDTLSANQLDRHLHGTMNSGHTPLPDEQVIWIRKQVAGGTPQRTLARSLNLSEALISRMVNRKTYRHV